jgi:hypothetical protein
MRNTVWLLTVDTSMSPEKGMDGRGCRLNPSSVLMTSMSAQSDGRTAQSGLGQVHAQPRLVAVVVDCEAIARER